MSMSKLPLTANIVLGQEYSPVEQVEEGELARNKEPREHCCCNKFHVEAASKAIAILALFNYTLLLIAILGVDFVWNKQWKTSSATFFNIIIIAINQSVYWCILIAQRKRIPSLYLPYLVVNALNIILGVGGLVIMFRVIVKLYFYSNDTLIYGAFYAFCVLTFLFNIWSEWVVHAAFKTMNREQQTNRFPKCVTLNSGEQKVRPIIMA